MNYDDDIIIDIHTTTADKNDNSQYDNVKEEDGRDVESVASPTENEDDHQQQTGAQQEQHSQKPTSTIFKAGNFQVEMDNRAIPYAGLLLSALVLLIALVTPNVSFRNKGYGIAVCVVSTVFAMLGGYMAAVNTDNIYDKPTGLTIPYWNVDLTWGMANAQFLFLWNLIAAGVLTFNGPFTFTSNGYFACWSGVLFAAMALGFTADTIRERAKGLGYFNALILPSIVQLCAVIPELNGFAKGESIYSLVVCVLTILLVVAFRSVPNETADKIKVYVLVVFCILWIFLACFVTFRGPFFTTGNGYFSAWLGCIMCMLATTSANTESTTSSSSENVSDDLN